MNSHQANLGTALALARLAEANEPPLLKHAVVNRNLALSLAGRNNSRAHQALQVLLSRAYRELHSQVHAPCGAQAERCRPAAAGVGAKQCSSWIPAAAGICPWISRPVNLA
jgi:hypothetical protein